jgi:hypothetical protein
MLVKIREGCVGEPEEEIVASFDEFREHVRVKRIQSDYFQYLKQDKQGSMLQIDFAMAYICEFQNEIQSALWSRQSVNLFTAAYFNKGAHTKSFLFVTDSKDKGKNTVLACLHQFFDQIDANDISESFTIFSDGPSCEFKNKYCVKMLHIINEKYPLPNKIQWAYSATSHGKGIVDGIGGHAKSLVRQAVMSKKNDVIVQCAHDFVQIARDKMEKTTVLLLEEERIKDISQTLWEDVQEIPGIRKAHVILLESGVIQVMKNHLERDPIRSITYENEEVCMKGEETNQASSLYKKDDWVAVIYDGKEYYGFVTNVETGEETTEIEVNVMQEVRKGCFKWPEKEDKVFYPIDNVLRKVAPPVPTCSRFFRF